MFVIVLETLLRWNRMKDSLFFKIKKTVDFSNYNPAIYLEKKSHNLNNYFSQKSRLHPNAFPSIRNLGFHASAWLVHICSWVDGRPLCSEIWIQLDNAEQRRTSCTVLYFYDFYKTWLVKKYTPCQVVGWFSPNKCHNFKI